MDSFVLFIKNNSDILLFGILFLNLGFLIWFLISSTQIFKLRKRFRVIFEGAKAADLEGVLSEEIKRRKKIERDLKLFHDDYKETKAMSAKSIQRIGVVRFNPFKDTGGNQSFVICLLDSKNDGFIISSLFTRDGSRFYTKPIEKGASNYALSAEEKEAIKKATSS